LRAALHAAAGQPYLLLARAGAAEESGRQCAN